MNYLICKILTPDFYAKFVNAVNRQVDAKIQSKIEEKFPDGVPDTDEAKEKVKRINWTRELESIMVRDSYYWMWGHKNKMDEKTTDILKHDPLWEPEFYEEIFENVTSGLQSHPRIIWKGNREKIDFIKEIIASREPKNKEEEQLFLAKKHETQHLHNNIDPIS